MSGKRGNGEGSIYPYRNGFAAYVWVTTPDGNRKRKYVYGPTRKDVHEKWVKLHSEAKKGGPVATNTPSLAQYLAYWLKEVVEPNLRPLTAATYETMVRLHIVPFLGTKRLDRLTVQDMRSWLNKLAETCQCCVQEKDAKRPEDKQRCCAVRKCCRQTLSKRSVNDARTILRSALANAMVEERISKNVAQLVKVQRARSKRPDPWSVEEACTFLENAQKWRDYLYGAYVLILVLGLRKGEVLGLTWSDVNLDTGGAAHPPSASAGPPAPDSHRHGQDRGVRGGAAAAGHLPRRHAAAAEGARGGEGGGGGISGRSPILFSPPATGRRWSLGTSPVSSTGGVIVPRSGRLACMTPGTPAPRCWLPSTSTPGSPCRSFAIPRSR